MGAVNSALKSKPSSGPAAVCARAMPNFARRGSRQSIEPKAVLEHRAPKTSPPILHTRGVESKVGRVPHMWDQRRENAVATGARPSRGAVPHVPDAGGLEGRVQPRLILDNVEVVPPNESKAVLQHRTQNALLGAAPKTCGREEHDLPHDSRCRPRLHARHPQLTIA